MDDDAKIIREFQRLSVGGFDDALQNSIQQYDNHSNHSNHSNHNNEIVIDLRHKNRPNHTFNSIHKNDVKHSNISNGNENNIMNDNGKEKYFNYIYDNNDNDNKYDEEYNQQYNQYNQYNEESISVDEIINDLKRRKENRLKNTNKNGNSYDALSPISPTPSINKKYSSSRFMLAAINTNSNSNSNSNIKHDIEDKYKEIINNKDNDIQLLQKQLKEKQELIESLQTSETSETSARLNRHVRQKSVTQQQTEQSTIENVKWSLRSEITKMTSAQNDINRLLQSVGDTSMIHGRLKKIYDTISQHKRKVSALEQSLNVDEFGMPFAVMDHNNSFEENTLKNIFATNNNNEYNVNIMAENEKNDFEILSKEYTKLKLQIAELQQEQNEWNNTKQELKSMDKRCTNLMNMLDKLSDEKSQLTLQIEDLHAFINKHNLVYNDL